MVPKKDVVLVTGSSGCLGQHVVKLLQEQDDDTGEIRLFDKIGYVNSLGHSEDKKTTEFVADIRDTSKLLEAMEGVDCVMHIAAVVDLRIVPDNRTMESVNVDGTQAVIDACLQKNVTRLIYASSTDILHGKRDVFYGSETTTPKPKTFTHGKYGESKWRAEELVLKASGQCCSDGRTPLRTLSLRPTAFYGEGDKHFITAVLKLAKKNGCHYRVRRSGDHRLQVAYVGNVAWSFLRAKRTLLVDGTVSGEAFFVTDGTPLIADIHEFLRPYLETRGFETSPQVIPFWLAKMVLPVISWILGAVTVTGWPVELDLPGMSVVDFFCSTFFFDRTKVALRLDYRPLYDPEDAKRRAMSFYETVAI